MSLLLKTAVNNCKLSLPGVKRVLITTADQIEGVLFNGSDFNTITGFSCSPGCGIFWLFFDCSDENTSLTETKEETENGPLYNVNFDSSVVCMDPTSRQFFEELDTNNLSLVIEDKNGVLWLIGDKDTPARLTAFNATTDTAGGVNNYSFSVSLSSRNKMRALSEALGASLIVLVTDCTQYAGAVVGAIPGPVGAYYNCFVQDFF